MHDGTTQAHSHPAPTMRRPSPLALRLAAAMLFVPCTRAQDVGWDAVDAALDSGDRAAVAAALVDVAEAESSALENGPTFETRLAVARARDALGQHEAAQQLVDGTLDTCRTTLMHERNLASLETPLIEIAEVAGAIDHVAPLAQWLEGVARTRPLRATALARAAAARARAGDVADGTALLAEAVAVLGTLRRDPAFERALSGLVSDAAHAGLVPDLSALELEQPPRPERVERPWETGVTGLGAALLAAQVLAPEDAPASALSAYAEACESRGDVDVAARLDGLLALVNSPAPPAPSTEEDATAAVDTHVRTARTLLDQARAAYEADDAATGHARFIDGTQALLSLREASDRARVVPPGLVASLPADELDAFVGWLELSALPAEQALAEDAPWVGVRRELAALPTYAPGDARLRRDLGLAAMLAHEWARAGRLRDAVSTLRALAPDAAWVVATASLARALAPERAAAAAAERARELDALDALLASADALRADPPRKSAAPFDEAVDRLATLDDALAALVASHPASAVARAADGGPGSLVQLVRASAERRVQDAQLEAMRELCAKGRIDAALDVYDAHRPGTSPWSVDYAAWALYREWFEDSADPPAPKSRARTRARRSGRKGASSSGFSEAGVRQALGAAERWLVAHQSREGWWDPTLEDTQCTRGDCDAGTRATYRVGVSALALLVLLGDGQDLDSGTHRFAVRRGLRALLEVQDEHGLFASGFTNGTYDHLLTTLALLEAWAHADAAGTAESWTGLREALDRALACVLALRNPGAGWRYLDPTQDTMIVYPNDASVTGWAVRVLARARDLGLVEADEAIRDGLLVLDDLTDPVVGRTGYVERGGGPSRLPGLVDVFLGDETESMTAAATLARLQADPEREFVDEIVLEKAFALLARTPVVWTDEEPGRVDHYYWMLATAVMARSDSERWKTWSQSMDQLVEHQVHDGCKAGSWDPVGPWGSAGGRVYSTAIVALTLEEALAAP